jgi:fatty acid desaturase
MKKRRKDGPEHLAKAGTSYEAAEHEQALERSAIADTMGLGNAPQWLKTGLLLVGALILVAAVVALIALD